MSILGCKDKLLAVIFISFFSIYSNAENCTWPYPPNTFECEGGTYYYGTAVCDESGTWEDMFCRKQKQDDLSSMNMNGCLNDRYSIAVNKCFKIWDKKTRKTPGEAVTCEWAKDTIKSQFVFEKKTYCSGFVSCSDDSSYIAACSESNCNDSKKCARDRSDEAVLAYKYSVYNKSSKPPKVGSIPSVKRPKPGLR